MKGIVKVLILSIFLIVVISACHNNSEKKKAITEIEGPSGVLEDTSNIVSAKANEPEHPGKAVFTKYCLTCHQADGSGVPGMHPPLGPGSWVDKDPKELIAIMMKGLNGKVEVNGNTYNGSMPSQAQLTDEEIANVLSYVRISFGNNYDSVKVNLVKNIRSGR